MRSQKERMNVLCQLSPILALAPSNDSGLANKKPSRTNVPKGLFWKAKPAYDKQVLIFFHPDYTVGTGISPIQSGPLKGRRVAGFTAGRELHPALKIYFKNNANGLICQGFGWVLF